MCSFQPDSGPCEALSTQYFWNLNTRRCEKFAYGGCAGNINRFPSLSMCGIKCGKYTNKCGQYTNKCGQYTNKCGQYTNKTVYVHTHTCKPYYQ